MNLNDCEYYKTDNGVLYNGDCLDIMPLIKSVDMVLTDPPYGMTACKWDSIIPLEPMWDQLKRLIKPTGAIVMTASQPFTTILISSNIKMFKYCWVWDKCFGANFVQAKRQPIKTHEDIVVFNINNKQPNYYPQMTTRETPIKKGSNKQSVAIPIAQTEKAIEFGSKIYTQKYPTSQIQFNIRVGRGLHPTQKPVALMEYLIKTYTNENEIVLDFAAGSGTTGVACERLNRKWIIIEKEEKYCEIAKGRIENG